MHYTKNHIFNDNLLMEFTRNEPSFIKILKLAIGVHFNSPKLSGGDTQSSHIGYYFSTIHFKDWIYRYEPENSRPTEYAIFYKARTKSMIKVGSSLKPDIREYTIVYAIENVDFVKEMIKEDKYFQKYIETGVPNLDKMAESLHEVAEECVRYAKVYWKNEEEDALIVPQTKLNDFGEILKNSPYGPGHMIRRATGANGDHEDPTEYNTKIFTFVVPADKVKEYIQFRWRVNNSGGVDYEEREGKEMVKKRVGEDNYSDIQTIKKPNGDLIVGVFGGKFAKVFYDQCAKRGFVTNPGTLPVTSTTAGRKYNFLYDAMTKIFGTDGTGATKKSSGRTSSAGAKVTAQPITVTIAFADGAFNRGANIAGVYVKGYNASHRNKALIDTDDRNQSIEISGIDQETVDKMKNKFNEKGIDFTVM